MQTNYLSIIPVISKFEIPKGFGVIDKNVQNIATVHMLCTQPAERCNPMTSQWNSPAFTPGAVRWDRAVISILCISMATIYRWPLSDSLAQISEEIQNWAVQYTIRKVPQRVKALIVRYQAVMPQGIVRYQAVMPQGIVRY